MRRVLVPALALLLLGASLTPAAQADSTVVIKAEVDNVTNYFPLTTAWRAGFNCAIGQATPLLPHLRYEDDTPAPPSGLGTLTWGYQFQKAGDFHGIGVDVVDDDDLDTLGMQVYGPGAADGRAAVFAFPPGTADQHVWLGIAEISGGGDAWTYVDAASLTYAWDEYSVAGWQPTSAEGMSGTIDEYDTAHGSEFGYGAFMGFGCDGTSYLYDGFQYGPAGNVATLDFESLATVITISAEKQPLVAGTSTKIVGSTNAHYIPSTPVDLEVKAYGDDEFVLVTTVQALEETGWMLSKKVSPLQKATYRWHYAAEETVINDPAYSDEFVLLVRTALTAVLGDATIKRGQDIVVTGKTKPAKPGKTITLMRKTSTVPHILATTRVKADGSYRIAYKANTTGTWKVYTTIAKSPGNLDGKSPIREVAVS